MTTSINKPTELSDTTGDTNTPHPVPASGTGFTAQTKNPKKFIKPVLIGIAGATASTAAVMVYRKLNKPVPKSEQIARKVRKYVKYLEKQDFEFPELPPQFRKTVEKKSRLFAKTARTLSKDVLGAARSHLPKKLTR